MKISQEKLFDSSCTSLVINRLFTHAHSCHSLPGHLISALTSLPRTRAASLTTVRLPSAHRWREGSDSLMEDGEGRRDGRADVPSCLGLLSVLACAASHPSYMAWRGENGKDPTKRRSSLIIQSDSICSERKGRMKDFNLIVGLMHLDSFSIKILDVYVLIDNILLLKKKDRYLCLCWILNTDTVLNTPVIPTWTTYTYIIFGETHTFMQIWLSNTFLECLH